MPKKYFWNKNNFSNHNKNQRHHNLQFFFTILTTQFSLGNKSGVENFPFLFLIIPL